MESSWPTSGAAAEHVDVAAEPYGGGVVHRGRQLPERPRRRRRPPGGWRRSTCRSRSARRAATPVGGRARRRLRPGPERQRAEAALDELDPGRSPHAGPGDARGARAGAGRSARSRLVLPCRCQTTIAPAPTRRATATASNRRRRRLRLAAARLTTSSRSEERPARSGQPRQPGGGPARSSTTNAVVRGKAWFSQPTALPG